MSARYSHLWWIGLGVVASAAWFVTAVRLTRIWGPREEAPAIGLLVAAAVALTLWRWARVDREQRALTELRCPRCWETLQCSHDHARADGLAEGVVRWSCERCGYQHAEALTCPDCAA